MYAYSLVGEVAYSMKTPQPSTRPAMEMIMVPDSSSMAAVGGRRVHVMPDPMYSAMLLEVRAVVSVAQMAVELANTNPNGLVVVESIKVAAGFSPVGKPENWAIPAPCVPELVPSVQYRVDEVATKEPTQD